MAFLVMLAFLTYFDRICIVRAQRMIQSDFGLTDVEFGSILGGFFLAYGLFQIPGGWSGDRFGARLSLTRIVMAWSAFTALSGAATGYWSLLAYRFCFGVGEAGAFANMTRVQSVWLPASSRGAVGGIVWLAARWGGAFSPMIFAALLGCLDAQPTRVALEAIPGLAGIASWRLAFWVAGLVGIVWSIGFYLWFRDSPAAHPGVNAAELALVTGGGAQEAKIRPGAIPSSVWRALFTNRSLLALSLMVFCGSFGYSFFLSWAPRYLLDVHGVEFETSDNIFKQPLFYGGIACLVGGYLTDLCLRRTGRLRLSRAVLVIAGYLVAAAAMFKLKSATDGDEAVFLMCLASAAIDIGQAATIATVMDIGGRYVGIAFGLMNMVDNMSSALQPSVGAFIFNEYGWDTLFGVYAGAVLVGASMWAFIDPARLFYVDADAQSGAL